MGSIAQAAPLQFAKSEPDALFGNGFASTKGLYIDLKDNKSTVYDSGIDGSKFSVKIVYKLLMRLNLLRKGNI